MHYKVQISLFPSRGKESIDTRPIRECNIFAQYFPLNSALTEARIPSARALILCDWSFSTFYIHVLQIALSAVIQIFREARAPVEPVHREREPFPLDDMTRLYAVEIITRERERELALER